MNSYQSITRPSLPIRLLKSAICFVLLGISGTVFANPIVIPEKNKNEGTPGWESGNATFECRQVIGENFPDNLGYKIDASAPNGAYTWSIDGIEYTITISNSNGKIFDWSLTPVNGNYSVGAVIVKAGTGANIWKYSPAVTEGVGLSYNNQAREISHVTFCFSDDVSQEDPPIESYTLKGYKFYDANVNGEKDEEEVYLEGWKIHLTDSLSTVNEVLETPFTAEYDRPIELTATEQMPIESNWVNTTAKEVSVSLTNDEPKQVVEFGNVCLGAGGGKTLGFWSNKNGQAQMNDDGGSAPELQLLSNYNLKTATGADFDPTKYDEFRTWILNAKATNMANMLSAQLAAMVLNVEAGFVRKSSWVYAPGVVDSSDFISIEDLLQLANASAGDYPITTQQNDVRSYQEKLKNVLDKANNNSNFVQPNADSCPYSFE